MVPSNSLFTILALFILCVLPLLVDSDPKYPKPIARNGLGKRAPENNLCAEGEVWESRRCDGDENELQWVDMCWNPELELIHEYPGECEGAFICTDVVDAAGDLSIDCIESDGDITEDHSESEGENDAHQQWEDGDDEDHEGWDSDEDWMGQVIQVPPQHGIAPHQVVRFMNRTIVHAAFTVALLSTSKDYIVEPYTNLTATVGNLATPICEYNATRRRCEPTKSHSLWHGDRITIDFTLSNSQAVFLVFTIFGSHAHAPTRRHLLLDREVV